jgi:6-phosphogluconolactonase/glucosamine-6-phosphate isomerase/deaminase
MKTHISETPEKEAGEYICKKLQEHAGEQILLLLSGGSAFSILDHIDPSCIGPHVHIGLSDERFTTDAQGNNFLQLQQTAFYKKIQESGAQFFDSFPKEHETQFEFSNRLKLEIEKYFYAYPESYALGIFGIGEDGHTAGIFPMGEKEFADTYKTAEFYIPVTEPTNTYPLRSSITPAFIEEVIDDVVLYAVGTNKCENILDYMYNRTFAEHEIPALIPASHPQSVLFTDCPTLIP